ncbi:two-component regulator propeller domain-containing protein [Haliea sp. E17]|uniref:two-component regulator propeller domain-containing protein n=1 Tax=Haliea sp. E17 TaxID=3401576 RepID=UPI003AAF4798
MRNFIFFITLAFTAIFPSPSRAIVAFAPTIDFYEAPFSKDLTQQTVIQSFQDSRGALWLATQEGLNRYTGLRLNNFRHIPGDTASISSNNVSRIAEDGRGDIWISTLGAGINRYDPISNSFIQLRSDPNNRNTPLSDTVTTIFWDNAHQILWIGYNNGLSIFDPTESSFRHFTSASGSLPTTGLIYDFAQTSDGFVWAGTESAGLIRLEVGYTNSTRTVSSQAVEIPNDRTSVTRVTSTSHDDLWIATPDVGVFRYDPKSEDLKHYEHSATNSASISSNKIFDIFEDDRGRIWVATVEGLNLITPQKNAVTTFIHTTSNLPSNMITSIYQTREGLFWIGTMNGLVSGSEVHIPKFDSNNSKLSSNGVNAFAETSDGTLWVGTDNGLNRLRPNKTNFEWINEYSKPSISSSVIMSLMGNKQTLWIGTYDAGLNIIDLNTEEVKVFRHSRFNDETIGANGVTSILKTNSNLVLVGTYGGGLSTFTPDGNLIKTFRHTANVSNSLSSDMVIALYEDSFGYVWVGTENGLNRFDIKNNEFTQFLSDPRKANSLTSDTIWEFYEDDESNLWIGSSGGGLISWPAQERLHLNPYFVSFSAKLEIASSDIYGITSDAEGNLWLSHNRGITSINKDKTGTTKYGIRDGLQSTEFNMGASFKGEDGSIYFGGPRGFNIIPNDFTDNESIEPLVAISSIKIMNSPAKLNSPPYELSQLDLTYKDRFITIEAYASDYKNPDLVQYAYKLEGIHKDWIISEDSHIASFTTLPPGEYKLRFAAANPSGIWNWDAISLPIVVHPPPWLSNYAYSLYAITLMLLLFLVYRRHNSQQLIAIARQKELEKKVQERTADLQIARAAAESANKAKSNFLATMTHEIRTPLHGMIGMTQLLMQTDLNEQQKQFTKAAHNSGQSLLKIINEILDLSKIEASKVEIEKTEFDIVELLDETCYLQSEPAARKGIYIYNIYDPSLAELAIGDPTKIRQVVMNLLSNAIKFTHKGEVVLYASTTKIDEEVDEHTLLVRVSDSGIGMDSETQGKIFDVFSQADSSITREYGGTGLGLSISKQYVELMNGTITVESEPGKGSTFTIKIPIDVFKHRKINSKNLKHEVCIITKNEKVKLLLESHLSLLGYSHVSRSQLEKLSEKQIYILDTLTSNYEINFEEKGIPDATSAVRGFKLSTISNHPMKIKNLDWPSILIPIKSKSLDLTLNHLKLEIESEVRIAPRDISHKSSPKIHVLIAEDVETNQRILSETLKLIGCTWDIAINGKEAFDRYKSDQYDIVFMDCQMPVMDGITATKLIREYEKESNHQRTPIVALTAGIEALDPSRFSSAGMDFYVNKPFSLSEIDEIVRSISNSATSKPNKSTHTPSPSVEQDKEPIIDESTFDSIVELSIKSGSELLPIIFREYISQMETKLSELSLIDFNNEKRRGSQTAHAIKSMSANIGANRVRLISAELEKSYGNDTTSKDFIRDLQENLKSSFDEFVDYSQDKFSIKAI